MAAAEAGLGQCVFRVLCVFRDVVVEIILSAMVAAAPCASGGLGGCILRDTPIETLKGPFKMYIRPHAIKVSTGQKINWVPEGGGGH